MPLLDDHDVSAEYPPELTEDPPLPPPRSWFTFARVLQVTFMVFITFNVIRTGTVWKIGVAAVLWAVILAGAAWEYANKRGAKRRGRT